MVCAMSRPYETGKTSLQPQISQEQQNRQRMQKPKPLALAIARPTFDITHATERWQVAQQTVQFAP